MTPTPKQVIEILDLLNLPVHDDHKLNIKELKNELYIALDYNGKFEYERMKKFLTNSKAYKSDIADDELFAKIGELKTTKAKAKTNKKNKKVSIKESAKHWRELNKMEVSNPEITDRDVLEANRHTVKDKKKYNKYVSKFLKKMREHISFEINLKSPEKKEAFRQAIRVFHLECDESLKPIMMGEEKMVIRSITQSEK